MLPFPQTEAPKNLHRIHIMDVVDPLRQYPTLTDLQQRLVRCFLTHFAVVGDVDAPYKPKLNSWVSLTEEDVPGRFLDVIDEVESLGEGSYSAYGIFSDCDNPKGAVNAIVVAYPDYSKYSNPWKSCVLIGENVDWGDLVDCYQDMLPDAYGRVADDRVNSAQESFLEEKDEFIEDAISEGHCSRINPEMKVTLSDVIGKIQTWMENKIVPASGDPMEDELEAETAIEPDDDLSPLGAPIGGDGMSQTDAEAAVPSTVGEIEALAEKQGE